ncbi:MAG: alkaline phosphatase PhoX [Gaiellaceae bacterium]
MAVAGLAAAVLVSGAFASHGSSGVKTAKQPFLVGMQPGVKVDPILSTGDVVPDGQRPAYQMSGIPDGLGAYRNKQQHRWGWLHGDKGEGSITVVMNHELGRSFPNNPPGVDTRVSRLRIDRKTHKVTEAMYLFTGLEGYERFCSATLRIVGGRPFYFTGEEAIPQANQPPGPAHDGSSIVMDPETGMFRDTAHFGHLQHENVVPLRLKQWVFLTTDDDFRAGQPAYLYAYISPSFANAINGSTGDLHVFVPNAGEETSNAAVTTKTQTVSGHFVPISQAENLNDNTLKAAATARGAFRFDRLEDAAKMPNRESRVFIADTGKAPATLRGRVYQMDFDRNDPTRATLRMILNGDGGDDIVNPDNMHASDRVLMIQEDREAAFRDVFARVLEYRFSDARLRPVARVNTTPGDPPGSMTENCAACRPGTWESSGIIDAGHLLGRDWWLLDVQAHNSTAPQPGPTLAPNSSSGENGQLLALYVPGSQGGDHNDDDDDDDDH